MIMAASLSLAFTLTCIVFFGLLFPSTAITAAHGNRKLWNSPRSQCTTFSLVLGFGDSTSDTGNAIRSINGPLFGTAAMPPYGSTFFHAPTGRFSDGRLMVDFLCAALKLPFLPPHLGTHQNGSTAGDENYAVAGATSLDVETLYQLANVTALTPDSLGAQVQWFKADTADGDLDKALVYVGEIGGNDYNYALPSHGPAEVMENLAPIVIKQVASSIEEILNKGVKKMVVQGQFPMGCIALYLKLFNGTQSDEHGCVAMVNALSNKHNELLRAALSDISLKHPDVEIVFFDTTAAYLHILDSPSAYNFTNVEEPCHLPPLNATFTCSNPQNYISWDGIHMTDAMYGQMMNLFLSSAKFSSPFPNFLTSCVRGIRAGAPSPSCHG